MPQGIIQELLQTIDESVNQFVEGLSPIQERTYKRLLELVKELDVDAAGNLRRNVANLRKVSLIKKELNGLVLNKQYLESVSDFAITFDAVTELQNRYFSMLATDFTPKKVLEEVKKVNIDYTIEALTEAGIGENYTNEITKILKDNITTGGSYKDFTEQLREAIIGKEGEDGKLVSYAKQIATDSINQYSNSYNNIVAEDLGLEYFQFVGSNIKTTRPKCLHMTKLRYFHKSEIAGIIRGDIRGEKVSNAGMIPNTTVDTYPVYRNGYNCGHGFFWVSKATVPENVRKMFES